jgi:group I intron endonuclease
MTGIYKITNPKGRVYIGQSKNIHNRFIQYKYNHFQKQVRLYNSIKKYGYEAHSFEVVCECSESELNNKERYYQELYNVTGKEGLNCELTSSKNQPRKLSEESKKKISLKNKGKNNGMYGKKLSEERKALMRNYRHNKESIKKISERSKRGKNPMAKPVLCLRTGVYYDCVADAAESICVPYDRLKQWLNGRRRNKSSMIHV